MDKTCTGCGILKPSTEYYNKHNKCKACVIARVLKHRSENLDSIRAYDRARGYRNPPDYQQAIRKRKPNQYKAQNKVNNAIRDGKLTRCPCEICGELKAVAHHHDYLLPLDVRWLCQSHHQQWHAKHGPALNPF